MLIGEQYNSIQYAAANEAVLQTSQTNSFDTFIHFQQLGAFQLESEIPLEHWETLLREWNYEPDAFLRANNRGNCVDFACSAQAELEKVGIESKVIGKLPDANFSDAQKSVMKYRHTSLISLLDGEPVMFEPGWKLTSGIPLEPAGHEVDTGTWKFKTIALTDETLLQETTSPRGKMGSREYRLDALSSSTTRELTKNLLRIPRRMEMLTPSSKDVPHGIIGFNPHTGTLMSTLDMPEGPFLPEDITSRCNEKLSGYFGFDVKEELLCCFAIYKALPETFWVR